MSKETWLNISDTFAWDDIYRIEAMNSTKVGLKEMIIAVQIDITHANFSFYAEETSIHSWFSE